MESAPQPPLAGTPPPLADTPPPLADTPPPLADVPRPLLVGAPAPAPAPFDPRPRVLTYPDLRSCFDEYGSPLQDDLEELAEAADDADYEVSVSVAVHFHKRR